MADANQVTDSGTSLQITVPDNGQKPAPKTDDQRPAWLPEKFKSPEDMATAYTELEKKLGQQTPAPTPQKTIETAGIDTAQLRQELVDNGGKLKDETKAALTAKGVPQDMVDAFITGTIAEARANRSKLTSVAGGETQLQAVYEWAGQNLSEGDLKAYNALVTKGDFDAAALALGSIVQRYGQAMGNDPKLVGGERAPGTTGAKPFINEDAAVNAMRDPRYANDPEYRAEVDARVGASNIFMRRR